MGQCNRTCLLIHLSLMLMTAGFGLTLMGWFAPPLNDFVLNVRKGGPITLLIGTVFLISSCFLCAIEQGNCCTCLDGKKKQDFDHLIIERNSDMKGPLILHNDSKLSHVNQALSAVNTQSFINDGGDLKMAESSLTIINENADTYHDESGGGRGSSGGGRTLTTSSSGNYEKVASSDWMNVSLVPPIDGSSSVDVDNGYFRRAHLAVAEDSDIGSSGNEDLSEDDEDEK